MRVTLSPPVARKATFQITQFIILYYWKRGIFWEGGVNSGRVAYSCWKKGNIFWEAGVYSGRNAHINLLKRGYILRGRVDYGIRRQSHKIIVTKVIQASNLAWTTVFIEHPHMNSQEFVKLKKKWPKSIFDILRKTWKTIQCRTADVELHYCHPGMENSFSMKYDFGHFIVSLSKCR